jgi:hypothetical protein
VSEPRRMSVGGKCPRLVSPIVSDNRVKAGQKRGFQASRRVRGDNGSKLPPVENGRSLRPAGVSPTPALRRDVHRGD